MESTIVDGAWKGHLGRGLAPRELQFVLSVAQGLTASPAKVPEHEKAQLAKVGLSH